MKLSVSLTNYSWPGGPRGLAGHVLDLARQVDDAGIDTLWVADHLLQMDPNASIDEPDARGVLDARLHRRRDAAGAARHDGHLGPDPPACAADQDRHDP
jgi:hypothetical protein